jgi:hypothetical protein
MTSGRKQVALRAVTEIALWRIGFAWPLALAIGAGALVVHIVLSQSLQARVASLENQLAHAQRAEQARRRGDAAVARVPDARALIDASPSGEELVARMVKLAEQEGIALPQSEYQQRVLSGGSSVAQLQITQPVRATYPQLRRYVEAVLRAIPNASLDQLAARRENVGQPQLEARLRWTLWLPGAAAPQTQQLAAEQVKP